MQLPFLPSLNRKWKTLAERKKKKEEERLEQEETEKEKGKRLEFDGLFQGIGCRSLAAAVAVCWLNSPLLPPLPPVHFFRGLRVTDLGRKKDKERLEQEETEETEKEERQKALAFDGLFQGIGCPSLATAV
ncbi:MAG: hypothetical protein U1E05_23745 [Patescibacteria group bacterium]|nr:hypothetical protein [Patescibacteria group bacterium]